MTNITIISFDPCVSLVLIERKNIKAIIEKAIKTAIEEAEKNHRVYKLDDLLDELEEDDE